ncbi:hypothetical protein JZ751_024148 [Albula glossodonta]|uniref:Uncharacterized protein n=1 Tax=Albula glossodonta TaxID=121402 RepID=A0A8T2NS02_9TELE|nr:hypothetical protein JZ751_024148 [Albula glossodonta]
MGWWWWWWWKTQAACGETRAEFSEASLRSLARLPLKKRPGSLTHEPGEGESRKKSPGQEADGNTVNTRPDPAEDSEHASELGEASGGREAVGVSPPFPSGPVKQPSVSGGFSNRCTKPKGPRDPPTEWT